MHGEGPERAHASPQRGGKQLLHLGQGADRRFFDPGNRAGHTAQQAGDGRLLRSPLLRRRQELGTGRHRRSPAQHRALDRVRPRRALRRHGSTRPPRCRRKRTLSASPLSRHACTATAVERPGERQRSQRRFRAVSRNFDGLHDGSGAVKISAGVRQPSILRGRLLSRSLMTGRPGSPWTATRPGRDAIARTPTPDGAASRSAATPAIRAATAARGHHPGAWRGRLLVTGLAA